MQASVSVPHPTKNVYDEYRTARLSVRYYETQLSSLKRYNFWMEFTLALSVPGIAGLWIWDNPVGGIALKLIIAIAALLAIAKPLIGLSDKIRQTTEVLTKWRVLDGEFQKLTMSIAQFRRYDDDMRIKFLNLLETKVTIQEPPEDTNPRIKRICRDRVLKELPVDQFFVPEE